MWAENESMPQRQRRTSRAASQREQSYLQDQPSESASTDRETNDGIEAPLLRSSAEEGCSYEYLDHTADIQIHAWGEDLNAAFGNAALAMFNYMTPLSGITCKDMHSRLIAVSGHDMHSLLFSFLDELLFIFSTEFLVLKEITVTKLDKQGWQLDAFGKGDKFDRQRHASGTEIKAITYSAMQVTEKTSMGDSEIFVIVDI